MLSNEFVQIFTEMGWVAGVLLLLGMLFCIIEIFIPGLGFFGISGSLLFIAGVIVRAANGASLTQILIMVLLVLVLILLIFMIMAFTSKFSLFGKGIIIERGTAISKNYFKKDKDKLNLIGKVGYAKTELNLGGIISVDDNEYEARTLYNFIPQGCQVEVTGVNENEIIVKRIM